MKQLLRSAGFILIFYSVAPNIIHEMTFAQIDCVNRYHHGSLGDL